MTTETIKYEKGDIWLCEYPTLEEVEIVAISGDFIKSRFRWYPAKDFHAMARKKVGVRRRVCGIPLGIKRL